MDANVSRPKGYGGVSKKKLETKIEHFSQEHICKLCSAKWNCRYPLCWEPVETVCAKCPCALPACYLVENNP